MKLWTLNPVLFDQVGFRAWWGNCCIAFKCIIEAEQNQYSDHPNVARFRDNHGAFLDYMGGVQSGYNYSNNRNHFWNRRVRFAAFDRMRNNGDMPFNPIEVSELEILYEFALLQSRLYWRDRKQFCRNLRHLKRRAPIVMDDVFVVADGNGMTFRIANRELLPPNKWTKRVVTIAHPLIN